MHLVLVPVTTQCVGTITHREVWEAQRGEVTWPGSHSFWAAELGYGLRSVYLPRRGFSQGCVCNIP